MQTDQKITYGLTKSGIVNADWFWNEVWLRANNNYGNWTTAATARSLIKKAIKETGKDAKLSFTKIFSLIAENKKQIKLFTEDMVRNNS